jgi:hypothetical protein
MPGQLRHAQGLLDPEDEAEAEGSGSEEEPQLYGGLDGAPSSAGRRTPGGESVGCLEPEGESSDRGGPLMPLPFPPDHAAGRAFRPAS